MENINSSIHVFRNHLNLCNFIKFSRDTARLYGTLKLH